MSPVTPETFGPWALVTGASSGIGEAFARELARRGFHVVLAARRGDVLSGLAAELQQTHGTTCRVAPIDLSEPDFVDGLRRITDELEIGLLVSNAGSATAKPLVQWDTAALEHDVAVNAIAHVRLAHHFARRFVERGRGGLLLVASIAGRQPVPNLATYAASKAFVTVLGESLHHELRHHGVSATVLVAGPTDTPMRAAMGFGRSRLRPMSPAQCAAEGLRALADGQPTYIPGWRTRLMLALIPRRVITRVLGRLTGTIAHAWCAPDNTPASPEADADRSRGARLHDFPQR
jgi:short-subunit dehydrogenase